MLIRWPENYFSVYTGMLLGNILRRHKNYVNSKQFGKMKRDAQTVILQNSVCNLFFFGMRPRRICNTTSLIYDIKSFLSRIDKSSDTSSLFRSLLSSTALCSGILALNITTSIVIMMMNRNTIICAGAHAPKKDFRTAEKISTTAQVNI